MNFLGLDVSATSTGWAAIMPGDIRERFDGPGWVKFAETLKLTATSRNWHVYGDGEFSMAHGAWRLKTEWTKEGEPHAKLHQNLAVLHELFEFDKIFYEKALAQEQRGGASTEASDILVELIGHVKSFNFAYKLRPPEGVHRATWQKEFVGSQKRGTKRKTILDLIEERARQLGFVVRKDDEAAAIGVLTYKMLTHGMQPPWLANEILRPPLGRAVA